MATAFMAVACGEANNVTDFYKETEQQARAAELPPLVNADDWLQAKPPEPDQIVADLFDKGDKVVLIGSSKSKKTFFFLQLLIAIATGKNFLGLHIPKPRRVLHIQYEIQAHHFHRRLIRMCKAMGIDDLGGRLFILNARGLGLSGAAGIAKIRLLAEQVKPDLISLDPLYKVLTGDENGNGSDGMKGILDEFDGLAEATTAAILYAHHDPKGSPGDRATTDRGAGGGVLGRDYDASLVMTAHATEDDAFVIETSLRNYKPIEPFTALWTENEITGGYCFDARLDILANKRTSKTNHHAPSFDTYLPIAAAILGDTEMRATEFRTEFKVKSGLTDRRVRGFLTFATAGGYPYILERTDSKANNVKWIKIGKPIE